MKNAANLHQTHLLKFEVYNNTHGGIDKELWAKLLKDEGLGKLDESLTLRYPSSGPVKDFDIDILNCLNRLSDCSLLIIDVAIPTVSIRFPLDNLRSALHKFFDEKGENTPSIVVVTPITLDISHALFTDVDVRGTLYGKVCAFTGTGDLKGEHASGNLTSLKRLSVFIKMLIGERSAWVAYQEIRANLLRRRGVFTDKAPEKRGIYYRYQYIIEPNAYGATINLVDRLAATINPDVVIVDTTSSFWMREIAQRLKLDSNDKYKVLIRTLDEQLLHQEDTNDIRGNVLILCGVTRKGGTANRIIQDLRIDPKHCEIYRAAVICDTGESDSADKQVDYSICWRTAELDNGTWYYLIPAKIETLQEDSWQVRAAEKLGEIIDLSVDNSEQQELLLKRMTSDSQGFPLSNVGLWDILSSLPIEEESLPSGLSARNYKLSALPDLSKIDPYDANWLAEIAILRFLNLLELNDQARNILVVIVPKSPSTTSTGAELVLNAMLKTRRVKGLLIHRETLFNSASPLDSSKKRDIELWDEHKFILFDETAVSLRTIQRLENLLISSNVSAQVYGTVFDVLVPSREVVNLNNFSLFRWIPRQNRLKAIDN